MAVGVRVKVAVGVKVRVGVGVGVAVAVDVGVAVAVGVGVTVAVSVGESIDCGYPGEGALCDSSCSPADRTTARRSIAWMIRSACRWS